MAEWIWYKDDNETNTWACFRKQFYCDNAPADDSGPLIADIAADSKYWLWVNGSLIVREGGLKRGPTPHDTYCDRINLSSFLKKGPNTLAVLVWYWGISGSSHKSSGKAGLYFNLQAPDIEISSDATWKTLLHPAFEKSEIGTFNNQNITSEWNVRFNALRDIPEWFAEDFDDTSWENAELLGHPPCAPWNRLIERPIPLWRDYDLNVYENAALLPIGRLDENVKVKAVLPYNMQLYPYFMLKAKAGLEIKVHVERDCKTTAYITREGTQEFEVPAWGNGHYTEYEFPKGIEIIDVKYRKTGFDTDIAGSFNCSDEDLNRLWMKSVRSLTLNMRDNYMDCPDRERSQWPGDVANALGLTLFALDRKSDTLTRKFFNELISWSTSDGILWGAVPTGRFIFREFASQSLAVIGAPLLEYYMHTCDRDLLISMHDAISRYLLGVWALDEAELLKHRGSWQTEWGQGVQSWYDWGDNQDWRLMDNTYYYNALKTLIVISDLTGGSRGRKDKEEALRRMAIIKNGFDMMFWNGTAYKSPGFEGAADDRGNALAVYSGLAEQEKWAHLLKVFKTSRFASIYMEKYVIEALFMMAYPEEAIERMKLRFSKELKSAYTTLPEAFGEDSNHIWGVWAATVLYKYIAGVNPTKPGFEAYEINPRLGTIDHISLIVPTVRGKLYVTLQKQKDALHIEHALK